jgi:hypothetical protein
LPLRTTTTYSSPFLSALLRKIVSGQGGVLDQSREQRRGRGIERGSEKRGERERGNEGREWERGLGIEREREIERDERFGNFTL